jgi:hypothetical protein
MSQPLEHVAGAAGAHTGANGNGHTAGGTQAYVEQPTLPHVVPYGQAPILPGQMHPVPVMPPAPPRAPRSAGFWAGTATVGAIVAARLLVGGFLIGQGTRMSNAQVQSKLAAQRHADAAQEQTDLRAQQAELHSEAVAALRRATSAALNQGRAQGQKAGYISGQNAGFAAGQSTGYAAGQSSGYAQGQIDGYTNGIQTGTCLANFFYC